MATKSVLLWLTTKQTVSLTGLRSACETRLRGIGNGTESRCLRLLPSTKGRSSTTSSKGWSLVLAKETTCTSSIGLVLIILAEETTTRPASCLTKATLSPCLAKPTSSPLVLLRLLTKKAATSTHILRLLLLGLVWCELLSSGRVEGRGEEL